MEKKIFFGTGGLGTSVPVSVKCVEPGQMMCRSKGYQTASNLIYQTPMQLKLKRALEFLSKSGFFAGSDPLTTKSMSFERVQVIPNLIIKFDFESFGMLLEITMSQIMLFSSDLIHSETLS